MVEAHSVRHRANMTWRAVTMAITVAALTGVDACNNGSGLTNIVLPNNTGIVTMFDDTTFDFATLRTFAMPDTVVHLFPLTGGGTPQSVTRMFDQTILDEVRQDLLNRGYTQVSNPVVTKPDFIVLVGVTASSNYNAWAGYSWFTFWGFYPGLKSVTPGFTQAWGIVYPWFSMIGPTSYDRGTLILDLIPTASVNPTAQTIQSPWAGVAMGLLSGPITLARVSTVVDQLFALSPFLTAPSTAVHSTAP